jgi:long-chain acyl-CoA synthetase
VQLQSALEHRFSVDLDDDALATAQTVADLRALVEVAGDMLQVAGSPAADSGGGPSTTNAQPAPGNPAAQPTTHNRQPATSPDHTYPHWPWSRPVLALRILWIELIMRPLVWLFAAPRVTCTQPTTSNLQPATPLLILANHVTAYDGALILYALPRHLRHHVAAAMSGEMLLDYRSQRNQGNWFLNLVAPGAYWLLTALFNVFPLPRAKGFRRSFAHAGEAMDRGYSVLIFPEGSRSHTGHINAFRPGIGLLAEQSHAPILPIALVGLYEATTPNTTVRRRWFHSGSIEVRIGPVIPAPAADADPAQLTAILERALRALLAEAS